MELLTKTGTYAPYENDCESIAHLEVYRLSEDEMHEIEEQVIRKIEEQVMPIDAIDAIMEFLDFEEPHYTIEPGAWYLERNFVAYNDTTGLLVIEVRKSLNV